MPPEPVGDAPWPPPPPPEALTCPKCKAKVESKTDVQTCKCGLRFALHAGPMLDSSLVVASTGPVADIVRVKSDGAFVRHFGQLDAMCVQEGAFDPVIGHIQLDGTKIAYKAVYSLAFWRTLPIATLIASILLLLPFTLLCLVWFFSTLDAAALIFAVPMTLLAVWVGYQVIGVRAHWVRVVGPKTRLVIRYDRPGRRRRRFHDELLRRCGIAASPIP